MSEQKKDVITRDDVVKGLEQETRQRGFVEYPKCLYHPDGRVRQVTNKREEEAELSADWCPTPADALKAKARRDERDRTPVAQGASGNGRK